ncbi:ATP-binding protein [Kitasatospora sp. NPDC005856]|uniref:sensor histidine kinase n=1 Tax=Kitasatospora sp. NPDC005856 TaxID=3154566 RepID=UPI0033DA782A
MAATERARLTALYGGLLVFAGVLLTGLVYLLVEQGLATSIGTAVKGAVPKETTALPGTGPALSPYSQRALPLARIIDDAEQAALTRLLLVTLAALVLYSLCSIALAWWMAGRVLRPVAVITDTARRLSGTNLHERIALAAPPGELKELADTFDGMLERIEQLVGAQQRFAANAAHELRTPLAVQRAAAEIGLDGAPDAVQVARIRAKLIDVAEESQRLIDGLLLLADSEQGRHHNDPVALHELAAHAAAARAADAAARQIEIVTDVRPVTVSGDSVLLERLVQNLVANAVRHNHPGGRVRVTTGPHGLAVSNTGPQVPPDTVPLLFEPFRRMAERRHAPGEGAGLGLSIVASVARAHRATVLAKANPAPGGGLTVTVAFPPADPRA